MTTYLSSRNTLLATILFLFTANMCTAQSTTATLKPAVFSANPARQGKMPQDTIASAQKTSKEKLAVSKYTAVKITSKQTTPKRLTADERSVSSKQNQGAGKALQNRPKQPSTSH